jgi:trk system potassium uptake protein
LVDIRPVLFVIGVMVVSLVPLMWICAIVDYASGNPDWEAFALCSLVVLLTGTLMAIATRQREIVFDRRQAFLLTVGMWIAMSLAGALPFYLSQMKLSVAQSVFETVSGITTTGSTVIVGLDTAPPGILLWRGLLQWIGGLGFIATGIILFPFLRIAGMQLFKMESSDVGDKATARMIDTVRQILMLYLLMTVLGTIAIVLVGNNVSFFNAVIHAMTAISTGGFSTSDSSVIQFESRPVEAVLIVLMIVGGSTFPLMIMAFSGRPGPLWRDPQMRLFFSIILAAALAIAAWRYVQGAGDPLRLFWSALFNVVSIITTTGYMSDDYNVWGPFPVIVFFFITFLGGCTGSTSGGLKAYRLYVLALVVQAQLTTRLYPRRVKALRYGERVIDDEIVRSVAVFMALFMMTYIVVAMGCAATGLDLVTSLSGAAQAVANVGPGLGSIIGPAGNFSTINDGALWFLSAGMLLGRLEIVVVLVIFLPSFWR